ncbi:MAG: recombinase family protein [Oscillospiraceae bacterium]|nr:recombinase family protein [Oscillospiraceae bacterium]
MNVAVYVRVSTQEQKLHGISVAAQEADCRAWVAERGHRLAGVYSDAGLSARVKYTKRPAMLRLLEDVRARRIDLIIFSKLDRYFRNVADYYEVQAILEAHGVRWRAIREDYETETASGRFKVNIMLAVAQDEADRTSERIKAAADYKRARGEAVGRPALGYRIEGKHWAMDPETQPAVEAFFRAYLDTLSVRRAMLAAAEHGLRLNAVHAGRLLRNPTYHGDAYGVPCPAYISEEQFAAIREQAGRRTRSAGTGRVFLFSGLLRCGHCGGAMTSAASPSKAKTVKYYRCVNHNHLLDGCPLGSYANEEKLERLLLDSLLGLAGPYEVRSVSTREW